MATIDLGKIKIVWRGTYAGGTAYTPDDAVVHSGTSYICIANTTGNAPPNGTYWNVLAQAGTNGTNGTDVGTVITTQGDILYRDGSGLQRLAAGTSGQVLQTGGSGANPSWTTISSDAVKIAEFAHTSGTVTSFDMDNIFSATYPYYKIIFHDVLHNSTGAQPWIRAIDNNGTTDSSSAYEYASHGRQSDGSTLTQQSTGNTYIPLGNDFSSDTEKTSSIIINVIQPYQTSKYKWFAYHTAHYCNNSSGLRYFTGGAAWKNNSTQMRGLTYLGQGTNNIIKQFKAIVYGFKGTY